VRSTAELEHRTVVVALASFELMLVADAVAVFEYAAQLEAEVALVTCTSATPPPVRSPKLQANVWLPTAPVIAQVPSPAYVGLMLQLIPVPLGSGSFRAAAVTAPVPGAA
jgi:hypothetical protein